MNIKFDKLITSKLFHNSIWLYVLQIFNTIVPLITLPYITRVLGASSYGVFAFSLNIIGYFKVLVDYGFELSGSRKIAMAESDEEISEIFTNITLSKIALMLISIIVFIVISFILQIGGQEKTTVLIMFIMILGSAIQQTWLFQGLQDMKFITLISVFSRILSVAMIFLLIKNTNQVNLYAFIYSSAFLVNGIISILIVRYKFNIRIKRLSFRGIINELKDGWYIFSTSFASKIFAGLGITVLGITTTSNIVGVYSAIYKIPTILIMAYSPFSQVLYPYVSKKYSNSFINGFSIVSKISKIVVLLLIGISIIIARYSELIIEVLFGAEYSMHHLLIIPLLFWVILSIVNNLYGIQVLVASGHQKEYAAIFRIVILFNVISNILGGYLYGMFGIAYAAVVSELILTVLIFHRVKLIKYELYT